MNQLSKKNIVGFAKKEAASYVPENQIDGPVVFSETAKRIFAAERRHSKICKLFNAGILGAGRMSDAELDLAVASL